MNAEERAQFKLAAAIGFESLCIVNPLIDLSKCSTDITMKDLVDLMHNIRTNLRYQRFDLEATARERDFLAKELKGE
jgi:hypothetical protein